MNDTKFISSMFASRSESLIAGSNHSTTIAKVLVIIVLFVITAVVGFMPFVLDRWFDFKNSDPRSKTGMVLRFLLFFGGGCLLCITFQHIVVEVSDGIAKLQARGELPPTAFNLSLFLMCIGFMIMFLVEEIVHLCMHRRNPENKTTVSGTSGKINDWNPQIGDSIDHHKEAIIDVHLPITSNKNESLVISSLRGLLIILALSIHALFEGLSIGLQATTADVWYTMGAICGHKFVLAFIIGIELIAAKVQLWTSLIFVFIFTIVAPIGVAVGIGVTDDLEDAVPSVIIQSIASGTLLYVTFFEILIKGYSGLWTYLGFILGFFCIWGIILGTHEVEKPTFC